MTFEQISKDLDDLVQKLSTLRTASPDTRERLDLIMSQIQEQHAVLRAELPAHLAREEEQIATAKATVADVKQRLAAQKAEMAAAKAKAAAVPEPPALAPKVPAHVDPCLCADLSDELIRQFGTTPSMSAPVPFAEGSVSSMSEAQWSQQGPPGREGSKNEAEVADEWAGVSRTPSTKKPSKKDTMKDTNKKAPSKAPPGPFVDDQSIGKAWEQDDDGSGPR